MSWEMDAERYLLLASINRCSRSNHHSIITINKIWNRTAFQDGLLDVPAILQLVNQIQYHSAEMIEICKGQTDDIPAKRQKRE